MAVTSYPNITLNSTVSVVLGPHYNGATITSTLTSSVWLVVPSIMPAGFQCWAVSMASGTIGVQAGSGATVSSTGGTGTSGQYGAIKIIGITDGVAVFTGSVG